MQCKLQYMNEKQGALTYTFMSHNIPLWKILNTLFFNWKTKRLKYKYKVSKRLTRINTELYVNRTEEQEGLNGSTALHPELAVTYSRGHQVLCAELSCLFNALKGPLGQINFTESVPEPSDSLENISFRLYSSQNYLNSRMKTLEIHKKNYNQWEY